jgi:photosystem II stability/assembly factor-like uncharacterized protein
MKTTFLITTLFFSLSFISCSDSNESANVLQSNWLELEPVTADKLNHINFYKNTFGIISGDFGTLLKINLTGNAINFENLNLEPEFPVPQRMSFILNEDEFYILKRSLFKTIDGGKSFDLLKDQSGNTIFGIHFFDSNTGFITYAGRLFKTIDGGINWVEVAQVNKLDKIKFINKNIGFLYGGTTDTPFAGGEPVSFGGILKTTDGGLTWTDLNLSVAEITALYFIDANTGYFSTTAFDSKIYKTLDGGTTWNLINDEVEGLILEMIFLDVNNGFLVTHEGKIYRTIDGGSNWSVDYETTNGLKLLSMAKTSDNQLFAVGESGLILKREN